jgi:hypothetical protein
VTRNPILLAILLLLGHARAADIANSTNTASTAASTNAPAKPAAKREPIEPIKPPRHPIPPEADTADITKFSFVVYGDTRGRRDGKEIQYEHSLIVDGILTNIARLAKTDYPIKFVLQSGDAVVNGREPKQWNKSFVSLINRITVDGGVPYFLAPGNHDVTGSENIANTNRMDGLSNYLAAVAQLIPPDGAPRRLDGFPAYAFGYGNSFFLALDSNLASNKTQLTWATEQLEGLDRARFTNVFAFFHHPPFSSGGHGGANIEAPTAAFRALYMPLFRKHHVRALLTGHEHLFEHWIERYQDANTNKYRMDIIVTGGGGAPLSGYRGEPKTSDYTNTFKAEKVSLEHIVRPGPKPGDNPYHFCIVKVDGSNISIQIQGVDWGSDFKPYQSNKTAFE